MWDAELRWVSCKRLIRKKEDLHSDPSCLHKEASMAPTSVIQALRFGSLGSETGTYLVLFDQAT